MDQRYARGWSNLWCHSFLDQNVLCLPFRSRYHPLKKSLKRRLGRSRMIEQSWRTVVGARCGLLGLGFVESDGLQQPRILSLRLP